MRRIVLPEGVLTLAMHEKISLVVVALYFFKIFILQKCCRFFEPSWNGFLTSTAHSTKWQLYFSVRPP